MTGRSKKGEHCTDARGSAKAVELNSALHKIQEVSPMNIALVRAAAIGALLAISGLSVSSALANPMVGGAPIMDSRNIIENAVNSADHATLVAAVRAAGLVATLKGKGRSPCLPRPTKRLMLGPRARSRLS